MYLVSITPEIYIFLAELIISIFDKNVHFLTNMQITHSLYILISSKELSFAKFLLKSALFFFYTFVIGHNLGKYDGGTEPSQPDR